MKILARNKLVDFYRKHNDAKKAVERWVAEVEGFEWNTPQDIKDRYSTASFLSGNTIYFNLKGDHYRLEVQVAYKTQTVIVKWIGKHSDYIRRIKRK